MTEPIDADDILVEALRITSGERQDQYGPPDEDFARTAKMWSALKGVDFTAEEVASFLICVKLGRNAHQAKRDNWLDIAGYSRCGDICRKARLKREADSQELREPKCIEVEANITNLDESPPSCKGGF